jgi:hypothetical protein
MKTHSLAIVSGGLSYSNSMETMEIVAVVIVRCC